MSKTKILVVEDERIVAKDIQNTLRNLGYEVPAVASTGNEAVKKAGEIKPDIVIMDIVLKGDVDGIEAASAIRSLYKIPIIYLTAYEDEETLDRAKITDPLGYILKPYEERDLHTALEIALYKHNMETKLTESEERYRMLVEHSPDGIAIEVNNKITFINPAALKMLKATKNIKYEKCSIFDFIPPENLDRFKRKLAKANENHSSIPFIEEQFLRTDGTKFNAEIAMIPFSNGSKIALQIIFRDITERKKADEDLRKAYAEIKRTQQALINSEKLAALGRFSAGIAHEIRNPLANISASAQFCMSKFEIDNNMKKHFDVILRNTESANRIIKELLDFTSPRETVLELGNINMVLERAIEMVKPRCSKHNINLEKKIQNKIPLLPINDKKLEEAFMNFLSNAIEAMPKGGTLTVESCFDENENSIIVNFTDTGCGISKDDLNKVYEPFFSTKDDGTGLGLSLAYHNVDAHSGEINIESKKGCGTTFSISFPITGKNGK